MSLRQTVVLVGMLGGLGALGIGSAALGAPPRLVKDVNTVSTNGNSLIAIAFRGSYLRHWETLGDRAIIAVDDGFHGVEPWVTDGTTDGTRLLRDLWPGTTTSEAKPMGRFGSSVVLFAITPNGPEIWHTDGTDSGTAPAITFNSGSVSTLDRYEFASTPTYYTFVAWDPEHGMELWRSDGTPAGTSVILDIVPGPGGSSPSDLKAVGGRVFFAAGAPGGMKQLWVTDGTPSGTRSIVDLSALPYALPYRGGIFPVGDGVMFIRFEILDGASVMRMWASDGTVEGTRLLRYSTGELVRLPRFVLTAPTFALFEGSRWSSLGLSRTDLTAGGTYELLGGQFGYAGLKATSAFHEGSLFFPFKPSGGAGQLWRSDGTAAGTRTAAPAVGPISNFAATSQHVYFSTDDSVYRVIGDGQVQEFAAPSNSFSLMVPDPVAYTGERFVPPVLTDRVLFPGGAPASLGVEPSVMTDTGTQLRLLKDIAPAQASSVPRNLLVHNGQLYFTPQTANRLTVTDGTAAGTREISSDVSVQGPFIDLDASAFLGTAGRWLVFGGYASGTSTNTLWRTDGTREGTTQLASIGPAFVDSKPRTYSRRTAAKIGDELVFPATSTETGWEFFKTDGTPEGTRLIKDLEPGSPNSNPYELAALAGRVVFAATVAGSGTELWTTDGTGDGTVLLHDLVPGAGSSSPNRLVAWNNRLFFAATTPEEGTELWVSDGTPGGASVIPLVLGARGSVPEDLVATPAGVYFSSLTPESGRELWLTDGTPQGTRRVADIRPGEQSSRIRDVVAAGVGVFFAADDGVHGRELWTSDGTMEGTRMVHDIAPGPESGEPLWLTDIGGGRVAFSAFTPETGFELYISDGAAPGTRLVHDLSPGSGSSFPEHLRFDGTKLYFSADDGTPVGRELYVWTPDPVCPCDISGDGAAGVQDIFDFLAAFISRSPAGDFNRDGQFAIEDVLEFLECWFGGCR